MAAKHLARREAKRSHPYTRAGAEHVAAQLRGRGLVATVHENSRGRAVIHVLDPSWEFNGRSCPAYTIS